MSPHQIIAVAVRLFAIWLALTVVFDFWSFYNDAAGQNEAYTRVVVVTAAVLLLVLVLVLWRFPLTIAHKLLSSPANEPSSPASPDLWLAMGCALIGLWFLVSTFFELQQRLLFYFNGYMDATTATLGHWLVYYVPRFAVSLWLIFGTAGFRKLFWWARNAGHGASVRAVKNSPPD